MTLEEKLDQLTLLSDGQMKEHPEEARRPSAGSSRRPTRADQHVPARRRRELTASHPDPVRFRHDPRLPDDLPDPAGHASSFDPSVAQTDHRIGAFESAAVGLKQIYSPMVDLSHEPRWGRISEAAARTRT
jgi:beta-glucosidase